MKKKLIPIVLCLAMALSCFAFTACGKDKGKVDVIAVSQTAYTDAEAAVKGYVAEELSFDMSFFADEEVPYASAYTSHESKGTVKAEKTNLTDDQKKDLASIEKVAVKVNIKYPTAYDEATDKITTDTEDITQTMYVLKYGETSYRYAVATPVNGERVSKSYIAAITKGSLYANCEVVSEQTEKAGNEEEYGKSVEQLTADAIYTKDFVNKARADKNELGWNSEDENDYGDSESYMFMKDNSLVKVEKDYGTAEPAWTKSSYVRYESISQYVESVFGVFQYIPVYLIKTTKSGFEATVFSEVEVKCTLKVSDGKITEMTQVASYEDTNEANEKVQCSSSSSIKISNFGKVTVTVPDDVKALA